MRTPFLLLILLPLSLALPDPARGQRIGRDAEAYVAEGDALLEQGRRKEAVEAYRTAVLADRDAPLPQRRLGALAAEEEDWREVRKRFNRVLDLVPGDLDAHYFVGIADRELGLFRPPFVNDLIEWRRARRHFETVLAADSTHRDVLYQYALLRSYQGGQDRWREALTMAHDQLRLRPDLADPHVGLFRLYDRYVSRWHDDDVVAWLRAQGSDQAAFFIGEILRRDGAFDRAEARFRELLARPLAMPSAPIHLALARIFAALDEPDSVEAHFERALAGLADETGAKLMFEDVKYVIDDAELRDFRAIDAPEAYRQFFRRVWARRNPLPAASANPRLVEHYRRLLTAEESYVHYGLRGWFNDPDKLGYLAFPEVYRLNHKFNDKGLIYVRHGLPDDRTFTLGGTTISNESWRYGSLGDQPSLIFHFTIDEQSGGGANWRLTPVLTDPAILNDLTTWGSLYQRMYVAATRNDRLDLNQLELEMGERSREQVLTGLSTDRHTWHERPRPLHMPFVLSTFRGGDGETLVEVAYVLPLGALAQRADGDSVFIEAGIAVHNADWSPRAHRLSTHRYGSANRPASDMIFGAFNFSVPADSYHVALHARVPGTNRLNGWKFDQLVPDYTTTDLALSDLLPAYVIRSPTPADTRFIRHDRFVLPNPSLRFAQTQPVFVYFEVYNLLLGHDDRAAFTVEYTLAPEGRRRGLRRLFGGGSRPVLSLSFDRESDSTTSIEYAGIDVSAVDPGTYELTVTVTDRNHPGRTFSRSRTITLLESSGEGS